MGVGQRREPEGAEDTWQELMYFFQPGIDEKTYSLHKILQEKTSPKKGFFAHVIIVRFTLLTQ